MENKLYIVFAFLILFSCSKTLELEIVHNTKDVINCLIVNNNELNLNAYQSKSLLDSLSFDSICDASGNIIGDNLTIQINNNNCEYSIIDSFTAQDTQLEMEVKIDEKIYRSNLNSVIKPQVSINIKQIDFIESFTNSSINQMGELIFTNKNSFRISTEIQSIVDNNLISKFVGFSLLYNIENENKIATSDFVNFSNFRNNNFLKEISVVGDNKIESNTISIISNLIITDTISSIELHPTITFLDSNLHQYLKTNNEHIISIGDPFTSVVIPFSNIDNDGLGIFGAYSQKMDTVTVDLPF